MCLALPGRILSIEGEALARVGRVDFGGAVRDVNLACVPEAQIGEYVIVHVGLAISRLDEQEAQQTLELLQQLEAHEGSPAA